MKWKNKKINLKEVTEGKKQTIIFEALEPLDISTLTSSCGCTTPVYNKEKNQVKVQFTPGSIPAHLKYLGQYSTTKTVTVWYKDGSHEVLTIKATVKRKL